MNDRKGSIASGSERPVLRNLRLDRIGRQPAKSGRSSFASSLFRFSCVRRPDRPHERMQRLDVPQLAYRGAIIGCISEIHYTLNARRMIEDLSIEPLALHPQAIPLLQEWFEAEWPSYYGAGGRGSALHDLQSYANQGRLPVGVVALRGGSVCGVAALKAESIASRAHLSPWAAAGLVHPSMRGQGIGRLLLGALEEQARQLGFVRVYCGTSTAQSLLQRCGWQLIESIIHEGENLGVYSKAL